MKSDKDLHQGHRQRLFEKVVANQELFSDHELLEVLLFFALPRVDTNPLAHKLLKIFGSVENLFCANYEELMSVDGVGKRTAGMLYTFGGLYRRAVANTKGNKVLDNFERLKDDLVCELEGLTSEACTFLMLDRRYRKIGQLYFASKDKFKVEVNIDQIINALSSFKPCFAIIAHNHNELNCTPSKNDDISTKKINVICDLHGTTLLDHIIMFNRIHFYSYRQSGRLDYIREQTSFENMFTDMRRDF